MTAFIVSLLIYAVYIWLPAKISYIFVGKTKLQIIQSRLAFLLTLAVLINVFLHNSTDNPMVLMVGIVNWILMVYCVVKRKDAA